VTLDLLKRLDVKVDFAAIDWGTLVTRWTENRLPGQGGWQMVYINRAGVLPAFKRPC
jgi:peptide/nickel transport system substrate-binding protein